MKMKIEHYPLFFHRGTGIFCINGEYLAADRPLEKHLTGRDYLCYRSAKRENPSCEIREHDLGIRDQKNTNAMNEAEKKFIVIDREGVLQLKCGIVQYHKELLGKKDTRESVKGGGRWHWEKETHRVYFYGKSHDFGRVSIETFQEALKNSFVPFDEGVQLFFSHHEYLSQTLEDSSSHKLLERD